MIVVVRCHWLLRWTTTTLFFFCSMPCRMKTNADSHSCTSLFSAPFSFLTVIFLKPYEKSSASSSSFSFSAFIFRQNRRAFDNNHLRKERTALRWSNWLYHIFTIYLAAKQNDVEKMHAYTGKTLPMAYTHIHIHAFMSFGVRKNERWVVHIARTDRKVKNQSCLQDVYVCTVLCIRLFYICVGMCMHHYIETCFFPSYTTL